MHCLARAINLLSLYDLRRLDTLTYRSQIFSEWFFLMILFTIISVFEGYLKEFIQ